jgi:hypothetical protein
VKSPLDAYAPRVVVNVDVGAVMVAVSTTTVALSRIETSYCVILEPPSFVGGVHETARLFIPCGITVIAVGVSGMVRGVAEPSAKFPVPRLFFAATRMSTGIPLANPEIVIGLVGLETGVHVEPLVLRSIK